MLRTELIAPIAVLLRRQAEARGDNVAFEDPQRSVTYDALLRRTGNLAGHLAGLSLDPGDRVGLLLPNGVDWVEACFAITRAGCVCVPISFESTESETRYRLEDAGCRAIVTTQARLQALAPLQPRLPALAIALVCDAGIVHHLASPARDLAQDAPHTPPRDLGNIADPSYIIYTSGTTGRAKGVLLNVRGMLWVTAACWAPICGLSASDRVLSPLPLFHSYALNLTVLSTVATGARTFIMSKFSTAEALQRLQSGAHTLMPGVPTMFHHLLQRAREEAGAPTAAAPRRLPGVRQCISAGAIMPATLNRAFEHFFATPLLDGYGITETSTMVTMNWPVGGRVFGSCGIPLPGLAVRIVDPGGGGDVAPGAEGEVMVRGPNVMLGYHNKPTETQAALRDGWYRTGDLARSDDNGFLTITGRLKELIIRGGENIAPAEIEEVVNAHPCVLDSAVIGVAHAELGEVPVLFVVARPGAAIDARDVLAHCAAELSSYKLPQALYVIAEIPRTGSGKIMRFKLREMLSGPAGTQPPA